MASTTLLLEGFPAVLSLGWRWGKRVLWTAGLIAAAVVILNAIHLYELLATISTGFARAATMVVGAGVAVWCAYVFRRYLRTPRVLTPPDLREPELGWTLTERARYARFAVRYLKRQLDNPHLPAEAKRLVPESIAAIGASLADRSGSDAEAATRLSESAAREIDRILAPLDARARKLIRRAAVEVAAATAVSPSILLDALITLARNLDLISRLADLYYGRPGVFGTLRIARDVLGSAVAAGALEVVTDHVSGAIVEMSGSWSARLIGPLGQGMINGVVTMRLGAAARWRCRSLNRRRIPWKPWELAQYRKAGTTLLRWVSDELGPGVFGPLESVLGWTGRAVGTTVREGGGLYRRMTDFMFRRRPSRRKTAPRVAGLPGDDPLLDSGLLGERDGSTS